MAELICAGKEDGLKGESEDEDERSAGIEPLPAAFLCGEKEVDVQ
jgi:hypothetical protein